MGEHLKQKRKCSGKHRTVRKCVKVFGLLSWAITSLAWPWPWPCSLLSQPSDWASRINNLVRTCVGLKQRDVSLRSIYLESYGSHNKHLDPQVQSLCTPMSKNFVVCTCVSSNCRSDSFINQYGIFQPEKKVQWLQSPQRSKHRAWDCRWAKRRLYWEQYIARDLCDQRRTYRRSLRNLDEKQNVPLPTLYLRWWKEETKTSGRNRF